MVSADWVPVRPSFIIRGSMRPILTDHFALENCTRLRNRGDAGTLPMEHLRNSNVFFVVIDITYILGSTLIAEARCLRMIV